MNEMKKWGILGCGRIAHAFAESLKELPDAKLEAVLRKLENLKYSVKNFKLKRDIFVL